MQRKKKPSRSFTHIHTFAGQVNKDEAWIHPRRRILPSTTHPPTDPPTRACAPAGPGGPRWEAEAQGVRGQSGRRTGSRPGSEGGSRCLRQTFRENLHRHFDILKVFPVFRRRGAEERSGPGLSELTRSTQKKNKITKTNPELQVSVFSSGTNTLLALSCSPQCPCCYTCFCLLSFSSEMMKGDVCFSSTRW